MQPVIFATSDTHNHAQELVIPPCDLFIHAGDISLNGNPDELLAFMLWLGTQTQIKHKIIVPGNHDRYYMKLRKNYYSPNNYIGKELLAFDRDDTEVLLNHSTEYMGLKIFGSAWSNFFFDWAFNGLEPKPGVGNHYYGGPGGCSPDTDHPMLKNIYDSIPDDTNIIISHGPPSIPNIFIDRNLEGEQIGSVELYNRCKTLPNLHTLICGHIHEGRGSYKDGNVSYYNVSYLDRQHQPYHKGQVIQIFTL